MPESEHEPHPLDVALGSRIRLRRRELGLSQEQLARQIGITFQQVQKYEHGSNRVSFSRLVAIAHALGCSSTDLIDGLDNRENSSPFAHHIACLNEPGATELLEAYSGILSLKHRRAIINLTKQLADDRSPRLPVAFCCSGDKDAFDSFQMPSTNVSIRQTMKG